MDRYVEQWGPPLFWNFTSEQVKNPKNWWSVWKNMLSLAVPDRCKSLQHAATWPISTEPCSTLFSTLKGKIMSPDLMTRLSFENLEGLWLSVSTDQQQLKHHCITDSFFILNPKDSIIQATMKKVNPIAAGTRTHLKTTEGRSKGTEYLLEVLHLPANSIHV